MTEETGITPIRALCETYVARWAFLDPVTGGRLGISSSSGAATDYSPEGYAAQGELISGTLRKLDELTVTSEADRLAGDHLRERLSALEAWFRAGEHLRDLRGSTGLLSAIHDSVDLLPRGDGASWCDITARLAAIPEMLAGWQLTLSTGLARGLPGTRRQAVGVAKQAERYVGSHDRLLAEYGDGPLDKELADAVTAAHRGYAALATYLRTEYVPRAATAEPVGAQRYAVAARMSLGMEVDAAEAYEWGWSELERIEGELAAEARRIGPGSCLAEVIATLDETQYVTGANAYLAWLREQHERALDRLHGALFDVAGPLRVIDVTLARRSTSGSAYYTPPSEDLSRPGRTWWPLGGRERFPVWRELCAVFHEGVPGHHLQFGTARVAGDGLSRFARFSVVKGTSEGWALYAERLADELGWFSEPGSRLGMLMASALRAARLVIDIGVHLSLPLPDGTQWTFEKACTVLRERGHAAAHQVEPEVTRYFGWPAQAITYKLGERVLLAARERARGARGFDLRRWHASVLGLGIPGLATLEKALTPRKVALPAWRTERATDNAWLSVGHGGMVVGGFDGSDSLTVDNGQEETA